MAAKKSKNATHKMPDGSVMAGKKHRAVKKSSTGFPKKKEKY